MKKTLQICSGISLFAALLLLVMGLVTTFNSRSSYFFGIAIFNMMRRGTFMGFIGNIISVGLAVLGFGAMGFYGFRFVSDSSKSKEAFLWGLVMLGVCAISLVMSIFARTFTIGDIVLLALPAVYTFAVFKTA